MAIASVDCASGGVEEFRCGVHCKSQAAEPSGGSRNSAATISGSQKLSAQVIDIADWRTAWVPLRDMTDRFTVSGRAASSLQ
jgi:hypothetical protein